MMRSLFSGVSGLKNHQTRMDVIGNNISNVNTNGFKSSRVTFADTLNQTMTGASSPTETLGGTNPKQIGLGSAVSSIDLIFTDGSVQSTGKNTDLCLSGNGLFVVKSGSQTYYTRNGAFEFDASGNYVMPGSGLKVQGWMAADGVVNTSGDVTDIVVKAGKSMGPEATTLATYTNNLKADTAVITKVNGYDNTNWPCSDNMPCTLTINNGSTTTTVDGTSGTAYAIDGIYSETTNTHSTAGNMVTVNKYHTPVTVTLAGGATHEFEYTSTDPNWQYGYTTTTVGDTATASSSVSVVMTNTVSGRSTTGVSGTTYKVGDTVSANFTSGTVTMNTGEKLILTLSDGTTHDVSSVGGSYVIGTDTYTYNGATYTVVGAEIQFTADEMSVISKEGDGASLRVGSNINDGYALQNITDGSAVTPSATNVVQLKLSDGSTLTNITTGGPFKVGDSYEGTWVTTNGATITAGSVRLEITDGSGNKTYHDDVIGTGTTYKVGDPYSYTNTGGTTVNGTITGYAPLSTITGVSVQKQITAIKETTVSRVESITPGRVTATTNDPLILTLSDGSTQTVTSGTYDIGHSLPISTLLTVYDSLGGVHAVPVYFTKTATGSGETNSDGNQWTISLDATDVTGKTNTITENDGSTTTVSMEPATIQFSSTGAMLTGSGTIELTLTDGANRSQTVTIDVSKLTQFVGNSTFNGTTNGHAAGTLESISIDASGIITGTYTNGVKQSEAQVAVAQFTNASGLTKTGSSLYQESNNSGTANIKTAGDLGVKITASALEMSNVDIANEFADMIITQRGFQSNSKIVTVGDEMLETVINMKR